MNDQPRRILTPAEHSAAWHAIEGTAGEPDADPGTVLNAVLAALNIDPPTREDEMAASLRRDGFGDDEIAQMLRPGNLVLTLSDQAADAVLDARIAQAREGHR
jgi:hypothetical protein